MAAPFRIYNTLTHKVEDFEPVEPGKIRLYVCGMTVYDHCHVGHARAFVTFDAFTRYLRHRGWDVNFVRNFTDVDDKIINRANETGEDALALSARFIESFRRDATGLALEAPTHEPKVTDSIPEILELIAALVERGHAYESEASVWFSVESDSNYGKLSRQRVDELRSADPESGKRSPADFALWKAHKPGEPSWDSPWGPGRPAWHIECSAMARRWLGDTIDIHGGGLDLVFPHHENEISQSQCGTGHTYVRYWMHNGLLNMASGQKMGKSLGNAINIHDALEAFPSEAIRIYYLQNHYRSPLPWSDEALPEALGMLARLYDAREAAESMAGSEDADRVAKDLGEDASQVLELGRSFSARYHTAMDQDFSTAQALGYAFELARAVNRLSHHKKARKRAGPVVAPALAAFALLGDTLGILCNSTADFQAEVKQKRLAALGIDPAEIEAQLAARETARTDKDWARADTIREQLESRRIAVMDTPGGVEWRIRLTDTSD